MEEKMAKKAAAKDPEQIGFHKGALTTLAKERQEFIKMLGIVEQLMQLHLKALKDLGVDLEAEAKKLSAKDKKKLEESLK
jgi:UDP-N-acetylglucosamine enolpyruvyl transferase